GEDVQPHTLWPCRQRWDGHEPQQSCQDTPQYHYALHSPVPPGKVISSHIIGSFAPLSSTPLARLVVANASASSLDIAHALDVLDLCHAVDAWLGVSRT